MFDNTAKPCWTRLLSLVLTRLPSLVLTRLPNHVWQDCVSLVLSSNWTQNYIVFSSSLSIRLFWKNFWCVSNFVLKCCLENCVLIKYRIHIFILRHLAFDILLFFIIVFCFFTFTHNLCLDFRYHAFIVLLCNVFCVCCIKIFNFFTFNFKFYSGCFTAIFRRLSILKKCPAVISKQIKS